MTEAQLAAHQANARNRKPAGTQKQAKYRNVKAVADGVTFDSRGEKGRYSELCLLLRAGHISDLKCGVYFELAPACDLGEARMKPALRYKADFTYIKDGVLVVEDFKSAPTMKTAIYRAKKHLMMTVHKILIRESRKC